MIHKFFLMLMLLLGINNIVLADEVAPIRTLVLVSHPYMSSSVMIKGLEKAAKGVNNVTVRNLDQIYGSDTKNINGNIERQIAKSYGRIVFVYPTHWFNTTPMLKGYLNETWGSVGPDLWKGKELLVVTTAGGANGSTYGINGKVKSTMDEILTPMKASALYAGMNYLKPLYFLDVKANELPQYQKQFVQRLTTK